MSTRAADSAVNESAIRAISASHGEPEWLLNRRLDAWRVFEAMAMPNPLEEEWRRTDISGLDIDAALTGSAVVPVMLPDELFSGEGFGAHLAQISGETAVAHRNPSLPAGVIFTDLHSAARDHRELVEPHLHSLVHASDWKLQALQAAAWQGGLFVHVPRNVDIDLPLRHVVSLSGQFLASHVLVVAEENSSVTLVQDHFSSDAQAQALILEAVEIVCKPNARVRYVETQRWGANVWSFPTIRSTLDRAAELDASIAGLGGRLTKAKLEVTLSGEGARTELLGLSLGGNSQHFDYTTLQDHLGAHTSSDLLFKAALDDSSSMVWNGLARIHKGASQSEANQTSRNLLLSDHARAAPIPVLEIEAYDVLRCSHGASAGPVDEEQLFYLESRGIPPAEAERLLVEAFFLEAVDRFPAHSARELITRELAAKIGRGG